MKIIVAYLRKHRACENQIALFESTFGESAEVTPKNVERAVDARLHLWYLLLYLLPNRQDQKRCFYERDSLDEIIAWTDHDFFSWHIITGLYLLDIVAGMED